MRPDQAHAAGDLVRAALRHGQDQPGLQLLDRGLRPGRDGAAVVEPGVVVGRRDRRVRPLHVRGQVGQRADPGVHQFGAEAGQRLVPHLQGGGRAVRDRARTPRQGLEQRRALPQHPVVVGPDAGQPRPAGGDQLVDEPAAFARIALDQRQVLGREHHGAQRAEQFARAAQRRPVEAGPILPSGQQFDLEQQLPRVVQPGLHPGPDDRPLGGVPHQRGLGRHPVRTERGQVVDRLDQVRLALSVGPGERGDTRLQAQFDARIRTEIRERQMGDEHPVTLRQDGRVPTSRPRPSRRARRTGSASRRPSSSTANPPAAR